MMRLTLNGTFCLIEIFNGSSRRCLSSVFQASPYDPWPALMTEKAGQRNKKIKKPSRKKGCVFSKY